jgi:hypothetical protein
VLARLEPILLALCGLLRCKCVAAAVTSFAAAPAFGFALSFSSARAFAAALSSRCVKSVAFVVLGRVAARFLMTSPAAPRPHFDLHSLCQCPVSLQLKHCMHIFARLFRPPYPPGLP